MTPMITRNFHYCVGCQQCQPAILKATTHSLPSKGAIPYRTLTKPRAVLGGATWQFSTTSGNARLSGKTRTSLTSVFDEYCLRNPTNEKLHQEDVPRESPLDKGYVIKQRIPEVGAEAIGRRCRPPTGRYNVLLAHVHFRFRSQDISGYRGSGTEIQVGRPLATVVSN
jgi:hypothetical protein